MKHLSTENLISILKENPQAFLTRKEGSNWWRLFTPNLSPFFFSGFVIKDMLKKKIVSYSTANNATSVRHKMYVS